MRAQVKSLEASLERTVHEYNEAQLQIRLCEESRFSHRSEVSQTTKLLREGKHFIKQLPLRPSPSSLLQRECGIL